jgi:hypothetical protein
MPMKSKKEMMKDYSPMKGKGKGKPSMAAAPKGKKPAMKKKYG